MTNVLALIIAAVFGACGWFWRGAIAEAESATAANKTLVTELESLRDAGPAIAAQVERMAGIVHRGNQLNGELQANAAQLATMADCRVPIELQRLSESRAAEINSNARAREARDAGLRAGVRD